MNNQNINNGKTLFYDFFSFPHNPEELFTLLYLIGKGDNYEIYKAINNETREVFCIKIYQLDKNNNDFENINKNENSSKLFFQKLKQETALMKSLKNCENITQYYGSYFSFKSKNIWLIYEYCPSGSISDLIKILDRDLTEKEISIIMNDILHGLIYIHQLNIIHRNLKITNILLNENGVAKMSNFIKSIQNLKNEKIFISDKNVDEIKDEKYDIFLLGIVCIELFMGIKDTNSLNRKNLIGKIKNNAFILKKSIKDSLYTNEKYISQEFTDFIKKCIDSNSFQRPSAFELISHPFINNYFNSAEKKRFTDTIRFSIEKIENYKKENSNKISTKNKCGNFYNSIYSNTKNTFKSHITNNDKNKSSLNISNFMNITNENNTTIDKLAEFRIEKMKNPQEKKEIDNNDNNDNKDLYSNIENTEINNITDESFARELKESAAFGKGEIYQNNETYEIKKKKLLPKNLFNKEEKEDIKKDNNLEKDKNIIKDSEDLEFKTNLDHLNKYEDIFKSNLSDNYSINNNNKEKHILEFTDDSIDINNNNEQERKQENYIPFSDLKCDIIQLGSSIQRNSKKSDYTSEYSLKNSVSKLGENNFIDSKDNSPNIQKKLLLSFGINAINDIEINNKNYIKEKNNKPERSTCFASLNSKTNNKQKGINSCKLLIHIRKSYFEDNIIKIINKSKKNNNYINNNLRKKSSNSDSNDKTDNFSNYIHSERCISPYLYRFFEEYDVKKDRENAIKSGKINIIKINNVFNKQKGNKIFLQKDIKNIKNNKSY